jgi:hypothetical protein
MALSPATDNGTFAPVVRTGDNNKVMRIAATGAAIVLALGAIVALVGVSTQTAGAESRLQIKEIAGISMPRASTDMLAQYFLRHGAKLSPEEALSKIHAWTIHPDAETATLMGVQPAATMMLALQPRKMSLQDTSLLCEKKAKILQLFDTLLAKLGGEELSANITFGKVSKEYNDALSSWLDSESHYRLTVEQVKDAESGASFASDEYEKWKVASKKAKADLAITLARHAEERKNLDEEREVIKEIMRYSPDDS